MRLIINVDEGVPVPGPDREDPRLAQIRELKIGDSFFVEGAKRADFRSLLHLGRRHDILLVTEYQKDDPIYFKEGVRVWRVETLPERKYRKPKATTKPRRKPATKVVEQDDDL